VTVMILLLLPHVPAHAMQIEIEFEGRHLRVRVAFALAGPVAGARITVNTPEGSRTLLDGVTDAAGTFFCKLPDGVSSVEVVASHSGHRVVVSVSPDTSGAATAPTTRRLDNAAYLWKLPLGVFLILGVFWLIRILRLGRR